MGIPVRTVPRVEVFARVARERDESAAVILRGRGKSKFRFFRRKKTAACHVGAKNFALEVVTTSHVKLLLTVRSLVLFTPETGAENGEQARRTPVATRIGIIYRRLCCVGDRRRGKNCRRNTLQR